MSLKSLAWQINKKKRMYAMAKQNVTVSKNVGGKSQIITNSIASAKIADLLCTNPASQACQEVCQDAEFIKLASTGEGRYSVNVQKLADDDKTVENEYTVAMDKKSVAEFAKGVLAIGKAIDGLATLKTVVGEMGARGRKSLVADFSEL
jgi:hypothetical protein